MYEVRIRYIKHTDVTYSVVALVWIAIEDRSIRVSLILGLEN